MNLYAPLYYKKFKCIADKCSHSCCIGWEIDIDQSTCEKYTCLNGGYGDTVKQSIANTVPPTFKLGENDRCPHLNHTGLCNIITNLGEDYLCEICREHPRFYNDTPYGKEVGLGLACEEACRIILNSDEYKSFYIVEELDGEPGECDFDPLPYRERIFEILSLDLPYEERLNIISQEFNISTSVLSDGEWRACLSDLEYLDPQHAQMLLNFSADCQMDCYDKELERAFAYFVYRHTAQAFDEYDFYSSLGFALLCERLLCFLSKTTDIYLAARIISEELEYSEDNTEAIKDVFYKKIL